MVEYGYMDGGYLRSKILEPITEKYYDDKGNIQERVISVEEQIKLLPPEIKPVDLVDDDKMVSKQEFHTIRITPYDNGDRISYKYTEVPDFYYIKNRIALLKEQLSGLDYKTTKCYEASLCGLESPYDINNVLEQKNALRAEINVLEDKFNEFTNELDK